MAIVSFNPTATAILYDGTNAEEVREEIKRRTGKAHMAGLEQSKYYVIFMGDVYVMTSEQFQGAQGVV